MCMAHQKEANRIHQVGYKTKWSYVLNSGSGIENEEDKLCAYPSCTNSQVIAPSFAPQSEIFFLVQIQEEPVSSILLCSMHYKELYKQVKYQSCASCGIKPKKGINLSRHCPNPTIYNSIFNGDSDSQLCSNDYICSSCYKQQLSIIKAHEQSNQFRAIWENTLAETTDKLTRAILHSVYYAAIVSLEGAETPQQLFNAQEKQLPKDMHLQWYISIRAIVSDRITTGQNALAYLNVTLVSLHS